MLCLYLLNHNSSQTKTVCLSLISCVRRAPIIHNWTMQIWTKRSRYRQEWTNKYNDCSMLIIQNYHLEVQLVPLLESALLRVGWDLKFHYFQDFPNCSPVACQAYWHPLHLGTTYQKLARYKVHLTVCLWEIFPEFVI